MELSVGICIVVIYWTTSVFLFDTSIFWDDMLLTDQRLVYPNVNPFHFWMWHSGVNKAWPMSYFINWAASAVSTLQFPILRLLLVLFHFLNATLILKIVSRAHGRIGVWSALYFLAHPLHFFTVSWTFQVFTVLSVFLILVFIDQILTSKGCVILKGTTLFYFSLAIKSFGMALIFLPWLSSKLGKLNKVILTTIFILISAYFYHMLTVGIDTYAIDRDESKKIVPSVRRDGDPVFINERNAQYAMPETALDNQDKQLIKFNVIFNNFWYYTKNTFLFTESTVIAPKNTQMSFSTVAGAMIFLALLFIFLLVFFKPEKIDPILGFGAYIFTFGFIPISGIAYVPHFRHSFTSPHWSYLLLVGAAFIFAFLAKKMETKPVIKKLMALYLVFFIFQQTYYRYLFSDRLAFFQKALIENPDSLSIKNLIENEKARPTK